MMIKKEILEYLRTIILTMLLALGILIGMLIVLQHKVYVEQDMQKIQDNTIDYYLIGVLIEKNLYLETKDPKDYTINLELGMLYEIKKDYKSAESEYKIAMEKSPYGEYRPIYKLALLYLRLNRIEEAQDLVDNLDEAPDPILIGYKGDLYFKLGDKYYNQADYEEAGQEYQKALIYYNSIKSPQAQAVENSLASAYVYLADQKVKEMQMDDAISSLEMALSIVKAPILKYKLAILLVGDNPELAAQYFEEVFNKEPSLLNYEDYSKFLADMASSADASGDVAKANLYRYKLKKVRDFFESNILYTEDLLVENSFGKVKLNNWTQKYNIYVEFYLRNVSKYNIDSLYLTVDFVDNNKIMDSYTQQVVSKSSALTVGSVSPLISLKTQQKKVLADSYPKIITIQIFASKSPDSYKLLLKEFKIEEGVSARESRIRQWLHKLQLLLHL